MRTKGASKIIEGLSTDVCHWHQDLGSISDQIMRKDLIKKRLERSSRVGYRYVSRRQPHSAATLAEQSDAFLRVGETQAFRDMRSK